jgi:hypothetical protein
MVSLMLMCLLLACLCVVPVWSVCRVDHATQLRGLGPQVGKGMKVDCAETRFPSLDPACCVDVCSIHVTHKLGSQTPGLSSTVVCCRRSCCSLVLLHGFLCIA